MHQDSDSEGLLELEVSEMVSMEGPEDPLGLFITSGSDRNQQQQEHPVVRQAASWDPTRALGPNPDEH